MGGVCPSRILCCTCWADSDVAISRNKKGERVLQMSTSHLWQLAETRALFGWSVVGLRMTLTLEGPKLQVIVEAPLEKLDEAIKKSAEGGWLHMLGTKAGLEDLVYVKSWEGLKQWVAKNWDVVVDAAVRRLREVLTEEELEKLMAPEGGDAPEGRKGGQVAPRDKPKDGENVWEELRRKLNALRDMLNDDKIAREAIAPALLLIQAERLGVNETTLKYFAAVISSTIDGDGYVSAALKRVELASGEREIALLAAATLAAYGIKSEVRRVWSAFNVVASGVGAARLAGLYFLYGAPLLEGDDRPKIHKLAEAVRLGAEGLNISWERLRRSLRGFVAADLTISVSGVAVKYNVYLRVTDILLKFQSTDRSRAELAARLLKLVGVNAEVKKESGRNGWRVIAYTDKMAGGHEKLRKALAEIVRMAMENRWVDADKAERWLEKLERGRVLREGWPKYYVGLTSGGALLVKYETTNSGNLEREVQWLEKMGLKRGVHFSVKTPEGGKAGYVSILSEGLAYAAYLSVHGKDEQQRRLAADFVEYILERAEREGNDVHEKVKKIIEEGKAWGSLTLKGFVKEFEVDGRKYVVKVIDGGAEIEESRGGKKFLRIRITAEVDGVRREYVITYSRRRASNVAEGRATARADAPGGREADAERLAAVIEALTGKRPRVYRKSDGTIETEYGREHLDGFMRYKELADAIMRWLEETGRR